MHRRMASFRLSTFDWQFRKYNNGYSDVSLDTVLKSWTLHAKSV